MQTKCHIYYFTDHQEQEKPQQFWHVLESYMDQISVQWYWKYSSNYLTKS